TDEACSCEWICRPARFLLSGVSCTRTLATAANAPLTPRRETRFSLPRRSARTDGYGLPNPRPARGLGPRTADRDSSGKATCLARVASASGRRADLDRRPRRWALGREPAADGESLITELRRAAPTLPRAGRPAVPGGRCPPGRTLGAVGSWPLGAADHGEPRSDRPRARRQAA